MHEIHTQKAVELGRLFREGEQGSGAQVYDGNDGTHAKAAVG
jgi:hypothetical protein